MLLSLLNMDYIDYLSYLFFLLYLLVPLLVTLLCRACSNYNKGTTMSISILIILIYPFILMWLRDMLYPPSDGQCGNPDMMFVMFNVII